MSANIYWEQVKPHKGKSLGVGAPSSFIESIRRAFADLPVILSEKDIPVLKGMSSMMAHDENTYQELIDAIEKYGAIKIWAEY